MDLLTTISMEHANSPPSDQPGSTDSVTCDQPGPDDISAVGQFFYDDMVDLGVHTTLEKMCDLAEHVVEASRAEDSGCLCWVARCGAAGLGADARLGGVVLANAGWSLQFGGRSLWIEELYVPPDFRRRGIGRQLVVEVVKYAETHGFAGIDLEAYQGNTPASVLYRTMGFHRLGRQRFYYRLGDQEYL